MKLDPLCRADLMQTNGRTLRYLATFDMKLEHFCCSLRAALACILSTALFK